MACSVPYSSCFIDEFTYTYRWVSPNDRVSCGKIICYVSSAFYHCPNWWFPLFLFLCHDTFSFQEFRSLAWQCLVPNFVAVAILYMALSHTFASIRRHDILAFTVISIPHYIPQSSSRCRQTFSLFHQYTRTFAWEHFFIQGVDALPNLEWSTSKMANPGPSCSDLHQLSRLGRFICSPSPLSQQCRLSWCGMQDSPWYHRGNLPVYLVSPLRSSWSHPNPHTQSLSSNFESNSRNLRHPHSRPYSGTSRFRLLGRHRPTSCWTKHCGVLGRLVS